MNQRQKEKKKKDRERAAKAKVLRRRTAIRRSRKEQREWEEKMEKENGQKQRPILMSPEMRMMQSDEKKSEVKEKLEHNLRILEALEAEYDREKAIREKVNEKLEAEGHTDIKDKLEALHQKALAQKDQNI